MAAEANLAVDFDDGYALIEPFAKCRIGVDVDQLRLQFMRRKQRVRVVAQMAACARVEDDCWLVVIGRWHVVFQALRGVAEAGRRIPAGGQMSPKCNVVK